jgi:hypothetical protein
LFLILAVVALGFQSLIVQPHIHFPETQIHGTFGENQALSNAHDLNLAMGEDAGGKAPAGVAPDKNDGAPNGSPPKDCSLCQSAHQNSQFAKPVAHLFSLPPANYFRSEIFELQLVAGSIPSFHWQTRAPPHS